MLEELTKEQTTLMKSVQDEWISYFFSLEFDEEKARELINWVYEDFLNLDTPQIFILDSPFACQLAVNLLNKKQTWDIWYKISEKFDEQVLEQVRDQVWKQVHEQVRKEVWKQVHKQVRDQVWKEIYEQVDEQVDKQVGNKLKYFNINYYLTIYDYYWVAFYDFFEKIGIIKHKNFAKFRDLIKCNIFSLITLQDCVFISKPPIYIKQNDENRLHSIERSAIKFADGFELYYVNGRHFTEEEFDKLILHKPPATEILKISNTEQRAEVIKHWGYEYIFDNLNVKKIDTYKINHDLVHNLYSCENLPINLLRVIDNSTLKPYILGVPARINDCLEAIAWTFNVSKKEYLKRIES